jgi:NADH:ubiquinone oxidoreductase subunit 5 (subunit L)/multisubunit Na+/H+ antiporter MnhA subunit
MTKSAQISFSSSLPAAIAAPTPVSALVHFSTLVTAGVYLLIRFSPSFGYWLIVILLLVSGLTIFMAGLGANFELDLRRIIALFTLSQLGQLTFCWPANRQSTEKRNTYQLLYIYSISPDDGLQICPKHVEVDEMN